MQLFVAAQVTQEHNPSISAEDESVSLSLFGCSEGELSDVLYSAGKSGRESA